MEFNYRGQMSIGKERGNMNPFLPTKKKKEEYALRREYMYRRDGYVKQEFCYMEESILKKGNARFREHYWGVVGEKRGAPDKKKGHGTE